MPRNPRKRTVRSVKASCDRLWSKAVRNRTGHRCERCAGLATQAHHAHASRYNHRLRFDLRNGIALCYRCHHWVHSYPHAATAWFEHLRPGVMSDLEAEVAKGTLKRTLDDYLALEAELREASR